MRPLRPETSTAQAVERDSPDVSASTQRRNSQIEFAARAARYRALHAEPAIRARTTFFHAAALICDAFALISAPAFFCAVSDELEHFNINRARLIRAGALGAPADRRANTIEFIAAEQAILERHIRALWATDRSRFDFEMKAANQAMSLVATGGRLHRCPAVRAVSTAIGNTKRLLERMPRFELQADRELVGRQLASLGESRNRRAIWALIREGSDRRSE